MSEAVRQTVYAAMLEFSQRVKSASEVSQPRAASELTRLQEAAGVKLQLEELALEKDELGLEKKALKKQLGRSQAMQDEAEQEHANAQNNVSQAVVLFLDFEKKRCHQETLIYELCEFCDARFELNLHDKTIDLCNQKTHVSEVTMNDVIKDINSEIREISQSEAPVALYLSKMNSEQESPEFDFDFIQSSQEALEYFGKMFSEFSKIVEAEANTLSNYRQRKSYAKTCKDNVAVLIREIESTSRMMSAIESQQDTLEMTFRLIRQSFRFVQIRKNKLLQESKKIEYIHSILIELEDACENMSYQVDERGMGLKEEEVEGGGG
eukprot:768391-Hanusia_phi.AAC.4